MVPELLDPLIAQELLCLLAFQDAVTPISSIQFVALRTRSRLISGIEISCLA